VTHQTVLREQMPALCGLLEVLVSLGLIDGNTFS
jgi:hypothetical protein